MDTKEIIKGKKILIVDDEPDILESLVELLSVCRIDVASSFEDGQRLLEENRYDLAILDIMGVDGFNLLETAGKRGVPALMLTAHGLSEENLKRALEEGASYYAPKDEINKIELFVADIIEAKEKNKNALVKWFKRLSSYYDTRFSGPDWREKDRAFFEEKMRYHFIISFHSSGAIAHPPGRLPNRHLLGDRGGPGSFSKNLSSLGALFNPRRLLLLPGADSTCPCARSGL